MFSGVTIEFRSRQLHFLKKHITAKLVKLRGCLIILFGQPLFEFRINYDFGSESRQITNNYSALW